MPLTLLQCSTCKTALDFGKIARLLSTEDEKEVLLGSLHPDHFFTLGQGEYLQDLIGREYGFDPTGQR